MKIKKVLQFVSFSYTFLNWFFTGTFTLSNFQSLLQISGFGKWLDIFSQNINEEHMDWISPTSFWNKFCVVSVIIVFKIYPILLEEPDGLRFRTRITHVVSSIILCSVMTYGFGIE